YYKYNISRLLYGILPFFKLNDGNFGPDPDPSRIPQKPEATVHVYISSKFLINARPIFISVFNRAPLNHSRNFNAKLHSVRMPAQGKLEISWVAFYFGLPVGGIVAQQYFEIFF